MTSQPTALDLVEDNPAHRSEHATSPHESPQHQQTPFCSTSSDALTAVKLTGRLLNFTRLNVEGSDITAILTKIAQKLGRQRQSNLPVLVSCQHKLNLAQLWGGLWALGLQPIGIVTGAHDDEAKQLRIAIFPADGQRIDGKAPAKKPMAAPANPQPDPQSATHLAGHKLSEQAVNTNDVESVASQTLPADAQNPLLAHNDPVTQAATEQSLTADKFVASQYQQSQLEGDLVHRQILRSGQSINHVGGDVILTKGINAGAEAITDYSLHVYGKAEGRLVAGATGDTNAKIFCLRFNPSLVSVAGTYCLKENIPAQYLDKAVQVSYLGGQGLVFELMD